MAVLKKFTKQPIDVQDYDIDCTLWLAAFGDTAISVIVAVADGITLDSFLLFEGFIKIWLSGGLDGHSYKVEVTFTTAEGRVKQVEIIIKVKET